MSINYKSVPAESGHWYDRTGMQVASVAGSKGQMVKPDIRHARKHSLCPGVTTIIREAHKEQLVVYRERQVLMAALTLTRLTNETDEDYIARVMRDAKTHAIEAAERGSEIHGQIERELASDSTSNPWVFAVRDALKPLEIDLKEWVCEKPCIHHYGYGTKSDLHSPRGLVLDFKTKDGDLSDLKLWPEHYQQLSATAHALEMPNALCGIVFVSRTDPMARLVMAEQDELAHGWETFMALLHLWQTRNKYRPEWASRIYEPRKYK